MKVKLKIYSQALADVISEGKTDGKKIADNFLALLIKAGQEKRGKEILDLAEDLLLVKQGKQKIIFETARKITSEQKKLLHAVAKTGDKIQEKIAPELIAGVKIIINDSKQFDGSLLSKMSRIFAGSRQAGQN